MSILSNKYQRKRVAQIFFVLMWLEILFPFVSSSSQVAAFFQKGKIIDKLYLAQQDKKVIDKTIRSQKSLKDQHTLHTLSVQSTKDRYLPGETATISLSLLDIDGMMVCTADVVVEITKPDGSSSRFSTQTGGVIVQSTCQLHDFTLSPDMKLSYLTTQEGIYHIRTSARLNQQQIYAESHFQVTENATASVERISPHRVYPDKEQPMVLSMQFHKDFHGVITERLPKELAQPFTTDEQRSSINTLYSLESTARTAFLEPDFEAEYDPDLHQISWHVDAHKGEHIYLSYGYQPPPDSPRLYQFEPLQLEKELEARGWQITIDSVTNATVDASVSTDNEMYETGGNKNIVVIDEKTVYAFYISGDTAGTAGRRAAYVKSNNGGNTWGTETYVSSATNNIELVTVWYDQWTPADTTGDLIHLAYLNNSTDQIIYRNIDTGSSDAQSSEVTIYSDSSTARLDTTDSISITKASDNDLYVAISSSAASSTSVVRNSNDTGANWTTTADEGLDDLAGDWVMLMPLSSADILLIRWDVSTNTIESKEYEDGGNTWDGSWASVATAADDSATYTETFASTLNPTTNEIYLGYIDNPGANPASIETRTYDGSTWSNNTQVISSNTLQGISMGYNTSSGEIVVGYSRGTLEAALNAHYKVSLDEMSTWSLEYMGQGANDDLKAIHMNMLGEYFLMLYAFHDDNRDIFSGTVSYGGGKVAGITIHNLTGFETGDAFDANSSTGTVSYSTSVFRSGEYALRSNPTSATGYVTHPVNYASNGTANTADLDQISALFRLRIATTPSANTDIFNFMDGTTNELRVQLDTDRNINLIDAVTDSGTFQLTTNTWYVIAVFGTDDSDGGYLTIYSDDMQTIHERLEVTGTMNDIDSIRIGSQTASVTTDLYFDDVVIASSNTVSNFPLFEADYGITRMDLDSNGTDTGWTNDYTSIDEIPTSTSDYIENVNAIAQETSNLESAASAAVGTNIIGVMGKNTVWETSAVAATQVRAVRYRIPNPFETALVDVNTTVGTDYGFWRNRTSSNTILTSSDLDSLQIGIRNQAANGATYRLGSSTVQVLHYEEWASTPTYSLAQYRWYTDTDAENVTDPWGNPDLPESSTLAVLPATNAPPSTGTELRLRIGLTVATSNLSASSQQFKLQYKAGTDGNCTTGSWTDVGAVASGSIWRFATSSVSNGTTLTALKLTNSDVLQVYTKENPSATNPNTATVGENIEYDFHLEHNGATDATQYSFRVVTSSDVVLDSYSSCPTLITRPGTENLLRHGNFFLQESEQGFLWAD